MKSVLTPQEQFAKIATAKVQRSQFDRSHGLKTAFDAGKLIPVFVDEAVPGDTFKLNTTVFGRLATPLKPIMDNIFLDVHFFSVPIRLVWTNWVKLLGEQENPGDSTDYTMPVLAAPASTGYLEETIYDYFQLPTKVPDYEHRVDFLRAMNLIWNEWYRDENLQDSVTVNKGDSGDVTADYDILPRGKRKDYFTSALPYAQKADPVSIPLGTSAPVIGIGKVNQSFPTGALSVYETDGTGTVSYTNSARIDNTNAWEQFNIEEDPNNSGFPNIRADLSAATAATVNAWRQAFQLQVIYELDARAGTRHTEIIKSHFGVTSPDARLQRPEFLGGFSTRLNINPIANTSDTATANQGDLTGVGTYAKSGHCFVKTFTEHEIILGFISARADLNYQQGLNRMWSRSTRFDFYWPSLANIGEQAILNKEIYIQNTAADEDVFGYQERYSEMKYKPSMVTGAFRSNHSASLDVWHLSQDFASLPTLDDAFIQEAPPIDRVVAVTTEPEFLADCYFDLKCARPMPVHSIPASLTRI